MIKSQSSTSHGFSSSGIFTFTSTLFINVSSWKKKKKWSHTNYFQITIQDKSHRIGCFHNSNTSLDYGIAKVDSRGNREITQIFQGLLATLGFCKITAFHAAVPQNKHCCLSKATRFSVKKPTRESPTRTLSTVGSTRALFFLGGWGVSLVLLPSPIPGAVQKREVTLRKKSGKSVRNAITKKKIKHLKVRFRLQVIFYLLFVLILLVFWTSHICDSDLLYSCLSEDGDFCIKNKPGRQYL